MPLHRRQMLSSTALTGAAALTAASGVTATGAAARTASAAPFGSPSSATSRRPNPLFPPLHSAASDLLALPASAMRWWPSRGELIHDRRVYASEGASNPTGLLYRWSAPDGYRLKPNIAQSLKPDDGTLKALTVLTGYGSSTHRQCGHTNFDAVAGETRFPDRTL